MTEILGKAVMLLAAAGCAAFGMAYIKKNRHPYWKEADAVVTDSVACPGGFRTVYAYTDETSVERIATDARTTERSEKKGRRVKILYDPLRPSSCTRAWGSMEIIVTGACFLSAALLAMLALRG